MAERIEDKISLFVKEQFPAFYAEDGEAFRIFLEAYYEFLEQTGNSLDYSRNLIEYHDVDETTQEFLDEFAKTYLNDLPGLIKSETRLTIKNVMDFYRSKGSPRSIQLLFRILFNEAAEVRFPSDDVLKPSSSEFRKPRYIEVYAPNLEKMISLEGLEIVGGTSGSKAFVESISSKVINKVRVHILQLSNLRGNFLRGEIIAKSSDGIQDEMPAIVGSLSDVIITLGGKNNKVGDTFKITADVGKGAEARVTSIADATGLINFNLANGGFCFSQNTSFTQINVNDQHLEVSNVINAAQSYSNVFVGNTHANGAVNVPAPFDSIINKIDNAEFFKLETAEQIVEQSSYLSATAFNSEFQVYEANDSVNNVAPYVVGTRGANQHANGDTNDIGTVVANGFIVGNSTISGANGTITIAPTSGTFGDQKKLTYTLAVGTHVFENGENVDEESDVTLALVAAGSSGTFSVGNIITGNNTGANGVVTAANSSSVSVNGSFGTFTADDYLTSAAANASGVVGNVSTVSVTTSGANGTIASTNTTVMNMANIIGAWTTTKKMKGQRSNAIGTISAVENTGASDLFFLGNTQFRAVVDTYANVSLTGQVIGSNATEIGFRNTIFSNGATGAFFANTYAPIRGRDSNTFANVVTVGTGSGAGFKIGTLENEEAITIYTDIVGENNVSNVSYLDCVIDGGNSAIGFLDNLTINTGGNGYSNAALITFSDGGAGGGPPKVNATANITTNSTGGIISTTVVQAGSGFFTNATPTLPSTTGTVANVTGNFDFGYGFPKDDNGDFTTILDNVLTRFSGNIGTIAAFSEINPGNNYNFDPFVLTRTDGIAKFDRKDLIVNLEEMNESGGSVIPFTIGEVVNQTVTVAGQTLAVNTFAGVNSSGDAFTPTTDNFDGLGVVQVINSTANTHGVVFSKNTTHLEVKDLKIKTTFANGLVSISTSNVEPFVVSATNLLQLQETNTTTTSVTARITGTGTTSESQVAKGAVYKFSIDNDNKTGELGIRRLSFSVGFNASGTLQGATSQAGGTITGLIMEDANTRPIGDNAQINADAQAANGIVTGLEITDSGFGYQHGANLTLVSSNTEQDIVVSGEANVHFTGLGPGYWASKDSFLNTKYLHDNDFYQEFSYVVESGLSLNKYRDILLKATHLAGTKLFGRVFKESLVNNAVTVANSTVLTGNVAANNTIV